MARFTEKMLQCKVASAILAGAIALGVSLQSPVNAAAGELSSKDRAALFTRYRQLIDAENTHNINLVRPFVWSSPSMLFVAKTKTAAEGNWAGFWGTQVVLDHLSELYAGPFHISPDYSREKVVAITNDVAETYVPVCITVGYAGQTAVPKPFLMILEWVRTPAGWRLATDIALPIPAPPTASRS
jgi:hypothetical protein